MDRGRWLMRIKNTIHFLRRITHNCVVENVNLLKTYQHYFKILEKILKRSLHSLKENWRKSEGNLKELLRNASSFLTVTINIWMKIKVNRKSYLNDMIKVLFEWYDVLKVFFNKSVFVSETFFHQDTRRLYLLTIVCL